MAKIFGGIGVTWGFANGTFLLRALFWLLVNDVIWMIPLALIVRRACKSGIE